MPRDSTLAPVNGSRSPSASTRSPTRKIAIGSPSSSAQTPASGGIRSSRQIAIQSGRLSLTAHADVDEATVLLLGVDVGAEALELVRIVEGGAPLASVRPDQPV